MNYHERVQPEQSEDRSPMLVAFDNRMALEKSDPLLALAFLVEAVADHRTYGGQDAFSKLEGLGREARRLLKASGADLGKALELYPSAAGFATVEAKNPAVVG